MNPWKEWKARRGGEVACLFSYRCLIYFLSLVEPAGEGRRDSASSGEGDYVSVRAPEEMDDTQDSRFSTTIKKWFSWIYYYFAMIVDKVIEILNDISKDYREIADQLKKEKKEKRREMIRRARAGAGSTRRPEQSKVNFRFKHESSGVSCSFFLCNSSQLSPSCFVIVMWLRSRIQTIEWFVASSLDLAAPFGHPPMQVLIL